jgi:hypothetical protein
LCPERGDIKFNGDVGSNLFVKTKVTDNYNIRTNSLPFVGNVADIYFLSQAFNIESYLNGGEPHMVAKVDTWQQALTGHVFNLYKFINDVHH